MVTLYVDHVYSLCILIYLMYIPYSIYIIHIPIQYVHLVPINIYYIYIGILYIIQRDDRICPSPAVSFRPAVITTTINNVCVCTYVYNSYMCTRSQWPRDSWYYVRVYIYTQVSWDVCVGVYTQMSYYWIVRKRDTTTHATWRVWQVIAEHFGKKKKKKIIHKTSKRA